MPTDAPATALLKSESAHPDQSAIPGGRPPLLLAVLSALILWSAFPPTNWWWLAWVGLAPFFSLILSNRSTRSLYLSAWVGGFVFWLLSIQWVRLTDRDAWLAWVVMALVLSVWWPGFLLLTRVAVRRFHAPIMLAAPTVWVGLEYIRAHILTGFAWYYLAHTQHQNLPMIQVADLFGTLSISILIALTNAWLVDIARLPLRDIAGPTWRISKEQLARGSIVLALLFATASYGFYRLGTAQFREGPVIGLLQSNLEQSLKDPNNRDLIINIYETLTQRALRQPKPPDLLVWPETSYPLPFVVRDPAVDDPTFERFAREYNPETGRDYWSFWEKDSRRYLQDWSNAAETPMLVGSLFYHFEPRGLSRYNSAILFKPNAKTIERYDKIHLVPFGEYIPLIKLFPWLTVLTPYQGRTIPSLNFGTKPTEFRLDEYRIATAICFEDTIPQAVRRFFRAPDVPQPDVVVNLSNDGWFKGSSEHDTHLATSVFRAIENRVPLARAANMGYSAIIDGNGQVRATVAKGTEGVLVAPIPLDDRTSYYSMWGDWLGTICLILTTLILPVFGLQRLRSRQPS